MNFIIQKSNFFVKAFNHWGWKVRAYRFLLIDKDETVFKEFFDLFFLWELQQIVKNL